MPLEIVRDMIRQRYVAHLVALGGTEDEVTTHDQRYYLAQRTARLAADHGFTDRTPAPERLRFAA